MKGNALPRRFALEAAKKKHKRDKPNQKKPPKVIIPTGE